MSKTSCYARISPRSGTKIFEKDHDYEYFLRLLKKYKVEHNMRLFAFCLLPHAAHFILEAANIDEAKRILEHLIGAYEIYLVIKPRVEDVSWRVRLVPLNEKTIMRYIKMLEFRPVFAGLVVNPALYRWSSLYIRICGNGSRLIDPVPKMCAQKDAVSDHESTTSSDPVVPVRPRARSHGFHVVS